MTAEFRNQAEQENLIKQISEYIDKNTDPSVNPDKIKFATVVLTLTSNIFIYSGIRSNYLEMQKFFGDRIYSNVDKEEEENFNEVKEILRLGYNHIKDFGEKLEVELGHYLLGRLDINGKNSNLS